MIATAHEGTFVGIGRNTVDQLIGRTAAAELVRIDNDCLSYGEHWRWIGGQQVFTEAGLERIVRELTERGHPGPGQFLSIETRRRMEAATVAKRWDLRSDFAD